MLLWWLFLHLHNLLCLQSDLYYLMTEGMLAATDACNDGSHSQTAFQETEVDLPSRVSQASIHCQLVFSWIRSPPTSKWSVCTDVCVRMSPVPPIQYQKSDFVLILCLVAGVSIPCQDQFQSPKGFFLTLIINYFFDWNKYCFLKQRRFRGVEKVLANGPPFGWHTLPSDFICHSHVWNKWSLKTFRIFYCT